MKWDSPFIEFSRHTWRKLRKDVPMTLNEDDVYQLQGQIEKLSTQEVEEIYLPLSRLLNLYVEATRTLFEATSLFLGHPKPKVPYIIGVSGSVAVGKSTTSRILKALLSHWSEHRNVDIVTTDGFLYPNRLLEQKGLMNRKGFPESYDLKRLIGFLADLKSGNQHLKVPVYSHRTYDILPNQFQNVNQPHIVIIEGLNVLQIGNSRTQNSAQIFVSDFFDFSIYVDANTEIIKKWFLDRFLLFRKKAKNDADAFFHQFSKWSKVKALDFANHVWTEINQRNLNENILPFKQRARLILHKNEDHTVNKIYLRKL